MVQWVVDYNDPCKWDILRSFPLKTCVFNQVLIIRMPNLEDQNSCNGKSDGKEN